MNRSEEHTSELQSPCNLVCRLLLEKKKKINKKQLSVENHSALTRTGGTLLSSCACLHDAVSLSVQPHLLFLLLSCFFFFFNDTATTEIYTLSLHDALPI